MLLQIPEAAVADGPAERHARVRRRPGATGGNRRGRKARADERGGGKDGVITSVSAMEGNCLCAVGQAVKKGRC